jgi:hypothetical protein
MGPEEARSRGAGPHRARHAGVSGVPLNVPFGGEPARQPQSVSRCDTFPVRVRVGISRGRGTF